MTQDDTESDFHNGYRGVFRFELERGETARSVTEHYVRDWLRSRKRGVDQVALDGWDGQTDTGLPSGAQVTVVGFEDGRSGKTAVRYRVTDAADRRNSQGSGAAGQGSYRVSVSAMSNPRRDGNVIFLVEVARDVGDQDDAVRSTHPPRIVANILNDRRVFDGQTRLQGHPRTVQKDNIEEVVAAVADPSRDVPLLIAPSVAPEADDQWRRVIEQLTRTSTGTAAVYAVASEAVDALNRRLPAALRTRHGHMREIAPHVDMNNPVANRHPVWTPEQLTAALDPNGHATEEAVAMVAQRPRKRMLAVPLPADLRRTAQLLDQEERRRMLDRVVEAKVADAVLDEALVVGPPSPQLATDRRFPRRTDLHRRDRGEGEMSFWTTFQSLLARWLDKPAANVGEETVEADLVALDKRIIREREALRVNEGFLAKVERERDDLQVKIAQVMEETDSLAAQLEVAERDLDESRALVSRLREQLEEHKVAPAEQPHQSDPQPSLAELQQKIQQAAPEVLDPQQEVGKALQLLGQRLDPLIQARLADQLDGLEWTAVLGQLDIAKGKQPGFYNRADPAAQLRMLTEKLGSWGFPFETDNLRSVSTAAQQLRSLRNRWSHHYDLEVWDATRAHDATHTLLAALGDSEGAAIAQQWRDAVVYVNGAANGAFAEPSTEDTEAVVDTVSPGPGVVPGGSAGEKEVGSRAALEPKPDATDATDILSNEGGGQDGANGEIEGVAGDQVVPSEAVMVRANAGETPLIGDERILYEPWPTGDDLPSAYLFDTISRESQERVRSVVEQIVDFEGPVALDRLVTLVAREFGLSRVYDGRKRHIARRIRGSKVTIDHDGFVWPESIDPNEWSQFRPTGPDVERHFLNVSPKEIRNAALFILEANPQMSDEELEVEVLRTFGKRRRTKRQQQHLDRSLAGIR